jgi:hypothetical protein
MFVCTRLKPWLRIISAVCGTYVNVCVYLLCENAILYYLCIEVIQSTLTCYIPKLLNIYIYIYIYIFGCQISTLMTS